MSASNTKKLWSVWLLASTLLASWFAWGMFGEGNLSQTISKDLMPGPMTSGHHQIAEKCDICHTDALGGSEVLQEACLSCHGDVRKKPFDSHPARKFKDPRNADTLEKINALQCISCHVEHQPEMTAKNGVTQPKDLCFHCHQEIAEDRPSHEGMAFDSCTDSGCHNFHNNRALYTDFLLKHLEDPITNPRPKVKDRDFGSVVEEIMEYPRDRFPIESLNKADSDKTMTDMSHTDFLATKHGQAGVNCSACHQPLGEDGQAVAWMDDPGTEGCVTCHNLEVQRFGQGKHGMRVAAGLSPMTPDQARLPMQEESAHTELSCTACHGAHDFNPVHAAADACLECHADEHSVSYPDSVHAQLWQKEISGEARKRTGVSCATCHMPRIDFDVNDWMSRTMVDHNQSANLKPNSKMIRSACLHCHGLGFAIDALADPKLITNNFQGQPAVRVDSLRLAKEDHERYLREMEDAGR